MVVRGSIHAQGFAKFFLGSLEILLLEQHRTEQVVGDVGVRIQRNRNFQLVQCLLRLVVEQAGEQIRDPLRPAVGLLSEAVQRYGGTVNRVTGDGLMALFGAPFTDEEHALGACCAALAMQECPCCHSGCCR